ncbi:MAG: hypothetical protein GY849_01905, partial [Deltaproteobacteria bacterium]|nr:hypothetical protein [Deltaproteobacteria bacterium]
MNKKYAGLRTIHWRYENGLEKMLKWALGHPNQGDPFPHYPGGGLGDRAVDVIFLNNMVKKRTLSADDKKYILNQLFFETTDDFKSCLGPVDTFLDSSASALPTREAWNKVYGFLEEAFKNKIRQKRREALKEVREKAPSDDFGTMIRFALGDPYPGDPLPTMPNPGDTLSKLYAELKKAPQARDVLKFPLAARYVSRQLSMSADDFIEMMTEVEKTRGNNWDKVCEIVERAQAKKRGFQYPAVGREEIQNIYAVSQKEANRFKTFRAQPPLQDEGPDPDLYYCPGFAVASPLLLLKEGLRTITLTFACKDQGFSSEGIEEILGKRISPFDVSLSGAGQWLPVDSRSVDIKTGDFVVESSIQRYDKDHLSLICTCPQDRFEATDEGSHIIFKDGMICKILECMGPKKVRLGYAGKIGEYPENVKVKDLSLDGEPVVMEGVSLGENKREIRLAETRKAGPTKWYAGPPEAAPVKVGFTDSDMGKYVAMPEGNVYIIERIITDTRARVRHWGVIPGYQDPLIKKYDRIRFDGGSVALPDIGITGIFDDLSRFKKDDTGQFVVWDNGATFRIIGIVDSREAAVKTMGIQEPSIDGKIKKYGTHKGLRFTVTLGEEFPEVAPLGPDGPAEGPDDPNPFLKVLCSNIIESEDYEEYVNTYYEYFKEIALESVKLDVKVENLTDVELRNDGFVLNPKTSFQPLGNSPRAGSGLYFSHPELSQKRLDSLDIAIHWMNCPEDFGEYYYAYAASGLRPAPPRVGNSSFKVHLKIFDKRSWRGIDDPKSLFDESDARALHRISFNKMDHEGYATDPSPTETATNNPFDRERYFKLELEDPDFQHGIYPMVQHRVATARDMRTRYLRVNPPYTPEVQSLTFGYRASARIDYGAEERASTIDRFYHMHPFGCVDLGDVKEGEDHARVFHLLPQYDDEGYLYVGVKDLFQPQELSILFQMASGSEDRGIEKPEVRWAYLRGGR